MFRHTHIPALMLVASILGAWGCSPPAEPYPAEEPALEMHTDVDALYLEPLIRRYEIKHGIGVNVRYDLATLDTDGDGVLSAKEIDGEKLKGDLVIVRDAATLAGMGEALAPLTASTLDRVAPRFKDAAGRWVGLYWQPALLAFPKALAAPPVGLSDLARTAPALDARWLGAGDSELVAWVSCGLAGPQAAALEGALAALAAPAGRVKGNHPHAQDALATTARGADGATLISPAEFYRFLRVKPPDGAKLAMRIPDAPCAPWSLAAIGVRAAPKHAQFVADFLALAMSDEGQAMVLVGDDNFSGNAALPVVTLADPAIIAKVSPSIAPDVAAGKIVPFPADPALRFPHAARARALIKAATAPIPPK